MREGRHPRRQPLSVSFRNCPSSSLTAVRTGSLPLCLSPSTSPSATRSRVSWRPAPPVDTLKRSDGSEDPAGRATFVKDPARWVAIPRFRYELHKRLNGKIDRMRDEFETYPGNARLLGGRKASSPTTPVGKAPGNNVSVLALSSVFPLHRHAAEPRLRSPDLLLLACHGQKEP